MIKTNLGKINYAMYAWLVVVCGQTLIVIKK